MQLRKIILLLMALISFEIYAMKVAHVYDTDKIKNIFKKDKVILNSNGLQIVGYNWGITLADLEDDGLIDERKYGMAIKMQNDGNNYVESRDGMDVYSNDKIIQYVKIDKILLIAYSRKNSQKKLEENLKKLLSAQLI